MRILFALVVTVLLTATESSAQSLTVPVGHPALSASQEMTQAAWRSRSEKFGETLVRADLISRGYQVHDVKLPGNRGIDLIAIQKDASGKVVDVKLDEVKSQRGKTTARMNSTKVGRQMSRTWLAHRLVELRNSGPEGKKLASTISRFHRKTKRSIESLGEIHDVNTRTGLYSTRSADSSQYTSKSLKKMLKEIANSSNVDEATKKWANESYRNYKTIAKTDMNMKLAGSTQNLLTDKKTAKAVTELAEQGVRRSARQLARGATNAALASAKLAAKAAGPIGLVVSTGMDGYELYTLTDSYRSGAISQRDYTIQVSRFVSGIAGASAGAAGGAAAGFAVAGPWGAAVGGAIGGISGYFGGTTVSDQVTSAWYNHLDEQTRQKFHDWFIHESRPPFVTQ